MARRLVCCLLLLTGLSQAWAASGMVLAAEPVTQDDCAGHMTDTDEPAPGGCCPDGGPMSAGCAAACSAAVALGPAPVVPAVTQGAPPRVDLPATRASPSYLPLNPPPIA